MEVRGKGHGSVRGGEVGKVKGENPIGTAGSGLDEGMRGINPTDTVESGVDEEMRGINPSNAAGSGLEEEMKGINPSNAAENGLEEGNERDKSLWCGEAGWMDVGRGISAPESAESGR